jgi:hypothetical protein
MDFMLSLLSHESTLHQLAESQDPVLLGLQLAAYDYKRSGDIHDIFAAKTNSVRVSILDSLQVFAIQENFLAF